MNLIKLFSKTDISFLYINSVYPVKVQQYVVWKLNIVQTLRPENSVWKKDILGTQHISQKQNIRDSVAQQSAACHSSCNVA